MDILPLVQVDAPKKALVGEKAYSLACLAQGKFPVPEGYIITAEAFSGFLRDGDLLAPLKSEFSKIDLADLHSVDYASRQIQASIRQTDFAPALQTEILQQFTHINADFVAVRSSAVADDGGVLWASQLPSFLHVSADSLLESVKKCWESLFSTRSLYYLVKESVDPLSIEMAVIVQKMIDAEISGRVYTSHPVTLDENQMVIEATYGFMEMEDAQKPPFDTYILQKQPFAILDANIIEQETSYTSAKDSGLKIDDVGKKRDRQKLSDDQIRELAELALRVETSCGQDTEMEWVFKETFYLVQTRRRL